MRLNHVPTIVQIKHTLQLFAPLATIMGSTRGELSGGARPHKWINSELQPRLHVEYRGLGEVQI